MTKSMSIWLAAYIVVGGTVIALSFSAGTIPVWLGLLLITLTLLGIFAARASH